MITPSFGITATERVLPKMALDFTTAILDPRVTFTRSGNTATVVNSSGDVAVVNANLPRFDHDPTTLACKGLLIEESRVNSSFNNTMVGSATGIPGTAPTGWSVSSTGSGLTREIVAIGTEKGINYIDIKYSGTATATTALSIFSVGSVSAVAASSGQIWTNSLWAKVVAGSTSGFFMAMQEFDGVSVFLRGPATAQPITANLTRYTQTVTIGVLTAFIRAGGYISVTNGEVVNITIRIGMPQLELGAFVTSVIPTAGSQVTRTADVATMTGTNFSDWYNDSIGTFVTSLASMQVKGTTDLVIFELFNNSAKNNRRGNFINAATGNLVWRSANNAGTIVDVNVASAATANASKTACAWSNSATFIAESVNASAVASSSSALTPTSIDTLNIGRGRNDNAFLNQIISKLFFYPQTLINAELQAFSK